MPIEESTVKWPERLSATVPVARLRLPRERFDSEAQLAFADVLRYNPWRSRPERRPLETFTTPPISFTDRPSRHHHRT
jgi:hypothetical protein